MVRWCPATWELPPPTKTEDKMISRMQAAGSSMERSLLRGKSRAAFCSLEMENGTDWPEIIVVQPLRSPASFKATAAGQPFKSVDESNDEAGGC